MNKKRIYVIGGCQGAGATFIATSLSFALSELTNGVAFVESPKTNCFKEEPLIVHQLSLEKMIRTKMNSYSNVYWCIYDETSKVSEISKSVDKIPARYIIYDSPEDYKNCDLIICVIDSLPSKVLASTKKVKHLKQYFENKTIWVLNRNVISNIRSVEKYLGIKFDFLIPMEEQKSFYKAEHFGKALQKSNFMDDDVWKTIESIAKYIVSLY